MKRFFLIFLACSCLALTPVERKIVLHAKAQLEDAQKEQQHSKDLATWAVQSTQEAWDYATETGEAAKKAKKEAQDQANEVAKMKPVYDAVTRWWDLGAFVWGFKQLFKHLFILAVVGALLTVALWGLSFLFPVVGVGLGIAKSFIMRIFKAILNRFKRK